MTSCSHILFQSFTVPIHSQVKLLYQRIVSENDSLKGLWNAKLGLSGRRGLATPTDLADYSVKHAHLDCELQRRRQLGLCMQDAGVTERTLLDDDFAARRRHRVQFDAITSTIVRLTDGCRESFVTNYDAARSSEVAARATLLLQRLATDSTAERKRLGCHALLDTPLGGKLIDPATSHPASASRLGAEGDLWFSHRVHGLKTPKEDATMQMGNGRVVSVPRHHFLHPDTNCVLPINGNICYEPKSEKLIVSVDCLTG